MRARRIRGLFLDRSGSLSIRCLGEAPPQLGLARTFVRVGIDLKCGLAVFEEQNKVVEYQEHVRELVQRGLQAARTTAADRT